jgi:cell fate (sporulation/competence/biofilm development) regulator YlbF (YheA/YmcA/DUF963 family)
MIKDNETRKEVESIKKKLNRIESIKQLSSDSTLSQVIDAVNRIINETKRRG